MGQQVRHIAFGAGAERQSEEGAEQKKQPRPAWGRNARDIGLGTRHKPSAYNV
jgi:hypothetical protein